MAFLRMIHRITFLWWLFERPVVVSEEESSGCYKKEGRWYCLPRMLGVASVGSGTTSLAHYLNNHPVMTYGARKEHHYFRFRRGGGAMVNVSQSTIVTSVEATQIGQGGWRTYASEFPMGDKTFAFDFDPCYLAHGIFSGPSLNAILELYSGFQLPKIVAVFRHPAKQHCRRLHERKTMDVVPCATALALKDWSHARDVCPVVTVDNFHNYCYAEHVVQWDLHFGGMANVKLLKSEELWDDRATVLTDLQNFLLDDVQRHPTSWPSEDLLRQTLNVHNRDVGNPNVQTCIDVHTQPRSFLSECNARLAALRDDDPRWLWWNERVQNNTEL